MTNSIVKPIEVIEEISDRDDKKLQDANSGNISMSEMMAMSMNLWEENKNDWSPMTPEFAKDFILYMVEEIGEVISIVKKKGHDKIMNDPQIRQHFIEEMCDVMMYHTDVLNRFGISQEEYAKAYKDKYNNNMVRNFKKDHEDS